MVPLTKIVRLYEPGRHRKPSSFSSTYRRYVLPFGHLLYPLLRRLSLHRRGAELVKRYTLGKAWSQADSHLEICVGHGVLSFYDMSLRYINVPRNR
jgi:hypothetical protein